MRALVYDCYYKNEKVKTVSTFDAAKEWIRKGGGYSIKEVLLNSPEEESKEARERREKRVQKICGRR